jgi:hypothetical protein
MLPDQGFLGYNHEDCWKTRKWRDGLNSIWLKSPCKFAVAVALCIGLAQAQTPEPDGAGLERGVLPPQWITGGPDCSVVPKWQVHAYNPDLYILRESGCTNYEKPFLYLFFGKDRALLQDTGAGETNVAEIVNQTIVEWCRNSLESPTSQWFRCQWKGRKRPTVFVSGPPIPVSSISAAACWT